MRGKNTARVVWARCGAIAVMVAVCLTVLMTVLAIGLDGGLLQDERRHAQATADASALAAATELFRNYNTAKGADLSGSARAAALSVARLNGYANDGTTSVVSVRLNPETYLGGPKAGSTVPRGYVEVTVQYHMPRFFSGVVGSGDMPVRARAVARGQYEPVADGVILLDLDENRALNAHGNGAFNVTGSGKVIVNSKDSTAVYAGENSTMYSESGFFITGGANDPSRLTGGSAVFGTTPVPDPLRYLPAPNPDQMPKGRVRVKNLGSGEKIYTLEPGDYRGMPQRYTDFSAKESVILKPGIYYFDGFEWSGQSGTYLQAEGVTIYNAATSQSNGLSITGLGSVSWSPPTEGPYKGLAYFQDRNSTTTVKVAGNGLFNITGTFYAANAVTMIEGNGDVSIGSQYISRVLDVGGNGNVNITYNPGMPPGKRVLQLVE